MTFHFEAVNRPSGKIIILEKAKRAQEIRAALDDPTGKKAAILLARLLAELVITRERS